MKKIFFFLFLFFATTVAVAQPDRFLKDIQQFKKKDSIAFPPKDAILLIGSSSFTRWNDVQDYFPGYTIINRGFGGSSLPDVIHYANDIIFPYQPKQIIIYCGENDFVAPGGATPEIVVERVKQLFKLIRSQFPKVSIAYISMKPSPSRKKFLPAMQTANKMIKKMFRKKKNAEYIDVYDAMLNADGSFNKEIYVSDSLHMNAKGYAIWSRIIKPYLKK